MAWVSTTSRCVIDMIIMILEMCFNVYGWKTAWKLARGHFARSLTGNVCGNPKSFGLFFMTWVSTNNRCAICMVVNDIRDVVQCLRKKNSAKIHLRPLWRARVRVIIVATLKLDTLQKGLDVGFPHILQMWPYPKNWMTELVPKWFCPYRKNGFGRTSCPTVRLVHAGPLCFYALFVDLDVRKILSHQGLT